METETIQEQDRKNDLNRMLTLDNILHSININQKFIEKVIYEKILNYEKKKDFDFEENKINELYNTSMNVGIKSNFVKIHSVKNKQTTKSLFTNESIKTNSSYNNNENKKKTSYFIDNNLKKIENNEIQIENKDNTDNTINANQFYKKFCIYIFIVYNDYIR